jgi:hypothetical protein
VHRRALATPIARHFSVHIDAFFLLEKSDESEKMSRRKSATEIEVGDETKLAELGYAQELKRDWSVMHNFGVSFSIISVITGITTLFR